MDESNHIDNNSFHNNFKCSKKFNSKKVKVPLIWCIILILGYLLMGAVVIYVWEGWTFWDSLYFCFLSLSTIGLGPAREMLIPFQSSIEKLALYSFYIVGGLSLIAMCFNLAQDFIVFKFRSWSKKLGILAEDQLFEEPVINNAPSNINPIITEQDFVV